MSNRPRRVVPLVLLSGTFLFAACDGGDAPTGPAAAADAAPPEITITMSIDEGVAEREVTLAWVASDDVGLASVSVSWSATGLRQTIRATGREDSGSFSHRYEGPGEFTIAVTATDGAGKTASATRAFAVLRPPPSAPGGLDVAVQGNTLTVSWEPGAWATSQDVVVSRLDGQETERVRAFTDRFTQEAVLEDLAWEASYEVRVVAENESGRAESPPVGFRVEAPIPPFLSRFSAATDDSTCLVAWWDPGPDAADAYDLVVTGGSEAESFTERVSPGEARLCATDVPIVDGGTYAAQVIAVYGAKAYGSNVRDWTVDFSPVYAVTGTWSAEFRSMSWDDPREVLYGAWTLELVEADGGITGTLTVTNGAGGTSDPIPVTGTQVGKTVELDVQENGPDYDYTILWAEGSFAGGDGMVLTTILVGMGLPPRDVFFERR